MNLFQAIKEAMDSLASNKMRTILTMLGIIIGVGAVIAMMAVGSGAQNSITGTISGYGSNLIFIMPGNLSERIQNPKPLTQADARAIGDPLQAPSIIVAAPANRELAILAAGSNKATVEVLGVTPAYFQARNYFPVEGELLTEEQLLNRSSIVLLGPDTAKKLFDRTEGITGETIRIAGQPYRVQGVMEARGGTAFGSQDDIAFVPLTTSQVRLSRSTQDRVDLIIAQTIDADRVEDAIQEIGDILRTRHRSKLGADDFTIFTQQDFLSMANTITNVLTIFLGGIAGISLLVGGIGIMNIMLVSVTERTKEIGLRKALGARKRDILMQFLTESALLAMFGGIIGIGLGWLIAFAVGKIAEATGTAFYPTMSLNAVLMATLFSSAVGLFFGLYPANRAANLEPVEALRHE